MSLKTTADCRMWQSRYSPQQQQGRGLQQGGLYLYPPRGLRWVSFRRRKPQRCPRSPSLVARLRSPPLRHFSHERGRDRRVTASYFGGQGGCPSHSWQPKQNVLMCSENKNTQWKVNPAEPIAFPILRSNCHIRPRALAEPMQSRQSDSGNICFTKLIISPGRRKSTLRRR